MRCYSLRSPPMSQAPLIGYVSLREITLFGSAAAVQSSSVLFVLANALERASEIYDNVCVNQGENTHILEILQELMQNSKCVFCSFVLASTKVKERSSPPILLLLLSIKHLEAIREASPRRQKIAQRKTQPLTPTFLSKNAT